MSYNVYRTKTLSGRLHHVMLFVETSPDNGHGLTFHVKGSIAVGMEYEMRPDGRPEDEPLYIPESKTYLGQVAAEDMEKVERVCESIPAPAKQVNLNGKPIDPSKPLRRCAQWAEEARVKLVEEGVLKP